MQLIYSRTRSTNILYSIQSLHTQENRLYHDHSYYVAFKLNNINELSAAILLIQFSLRRSKIDCNLTITIVLKIIWLIILYYNIVILQTIMTSDSTSVIDHKPLNYILILSSMPLSIILLYYITIIINIWTILIKNNNMIR